MSTARLQAVTQQSVRRLAVRRYWCQRRAVHICAFCGAGLDLPEGARVHTSPAVESDTVRVVYADGREIHRCEVDAVGVVAGTDEPLLRAQHVGRA